MCLGISRYILDGQMGSQGKKGFAYLFNFFSKPTLATFVYNAFL